jgi:hypothetical protein
LIKDVNEQLSRKAALDAHVNELQKRSKTLGRASEMLQTAVDELRARQKAERAGVDEAHEQIRRLEGETGALREKLQAAAAPGAGAANPEDLKATMRRIAVLESQIKQRRERHEALVAELEAKITESTRRLDDARSAETVLKKKMSQKRLALQTEINKRRGIVVHSSRRAPRGDSAQLFLESKNLIQLMAQRQEEVWELDERVAFTRNSRNLLAKELLKRLFAKVDREKAQQMTEAAIKAVLDIAEIDRRKNRLRGS